MFTNRKPAYIADAKNGDRVAVIRQTLSFTDGQKPTVVDTEIVGTLSGMVTVKQIPHSYIAGRLTEDNGNVHELKSRPDYHIEFVLDGPVFAKDTIAVTIGTFSPGWPTGPDEGTVCVTCHRPSDILIAEFRKVDLEPGEVCTRCHRVFVADEDTVQGLPVKIQYLATATNGVEGLVTAVNAKGIRIDWGVNGGSHTYTLDEAYECGFTYQSANAIAAVTFEPDGLIECTSCAIVGASRIRDILNHDAGVEADERCCKCNKVLIEI